MSALNKYVLVLDKNWRAISVIDGKGAICKLFNGSADALDVTSNVLFSFNDWIEASNCGLVTSKDTVTSSKLVIHIPDIIILHDTRKSKSLYRIAKLSKQNVHLRDNYTCGYCNIKLNTNNSTWDHIIPRYNKGQTIWTNLITCCRPCNEKKDHKSLEKVGFKLLFQPYQPTTFQIEKMKLDSRNIPDSWLPYI